VHLTQVALLRGPAASKRNVLSDRLNWP